MMTIGKVKRKIFLKIFLAVLPILLIFAGVGIVVLLAKLDIIPTAEVQASSQFSGNVLETCEQMAQYLISKDAHYGDSQYVSIENSYKNPDYDVVCVTYVMLVLWKSGAVPKEIIDSHKFHWTGDVPIILTEAGYHKVPREQARPGDVALYNPGPDGHVLIYAGEGRYFWDEACGVWTSHGRPNGQVRDISFYYTSPLTTFWTK